MSVIEASIETTFLFSCSCSSDKTRLLSIISLSLFKVVFIEAVLILTTSITSLCFFLRAI